MDSSSEFCADESVGKPKAKAAINHASERSDLSDCTIGTPSLPSKHHQDARYIQKPRDHGRK
jgi:hypothetical protein